MSGQGRPNSIYRQGRPKTSTAGYSRRNVVSPLQNRPGIKNNNPGALRPQTALGKGPRTQIRNDSPWGNPTESRSGSATFMAPVSMMKVAGAPDFASSARGVDLEEADAEVMSILNSERSEPEIRDDPILSRIPAEYHMFRSHRDYPVDEEGLKEIQMGVDGAWKTVVFPSLYPGTRDEVQHGAIPWWSHSVCRCCSWRVLCIKWWRSARLRQTERTPRQSIDLSG